MDSAGAQAAGLTAENGDDRCTMLSVIIGNFVTSPDESHFACAKQRPCRPHTRIGRQDRKALGLDIPPGVLAIVDAVIE